MKQDTELALKWLSEDPVRTVYQASKQFNIVPSTIYRALNKKICPACGKNINQ